MFSLSDVSLGLDYNRSIDKSVKLLFCEVEAFGVAITTIFILKMCLELKLTAILSDESHLGSACQDSNTTSGIPHWIAKLR